MSEAVEPAAGEEEEDGASLVEEVAQFTHDPLGFVLFAFDWGHGELAKFPHGPEDWQRDFLLDIGKRLRSGRVSVGQAIAEAAQAEANTSVVIQEKVASGHGVGKSTLVAWLILWAMSTCPDTRGVVTANTDTQLRTKTWAELAKWHRLCITGDWFELRATAIFSKDPDHAKTWRIDIVPWTIQNTEAFAGLHNQGKRILVIFDEASAIPDLVWEVTEGALTDADTEIIWAVFGNPTRNSGRFAECSGKYRHRWGCWEVDSRSVRITNKEQLTQWVQDEGEDSDFVRVRIRGLPPRSSMLEFIGIEDFERCIAYKAEGYEGEAKVAGVDCARFGDDQNVVTCRQGRKVRILKKWRGTDTQQGAALVAELDGTENFDAIFVDGGGPGAGIIDRLRVLIDEDRVIEVNFGGKASDEAAYANKRAEMWGDMRKAMRVGLELPDDPELRADLTGPLYTFTNKQQILLEKKEHMKKRGLASPDSGDSVALTFAQPVIKDSVEMPPGYVSPYRRGLDHV